jgi:aquaporin Z
MGLNMKKLVAEFVGTFGLVFLGCASVVIAGADGTTGVGLLGISFAFGLALIGMAYGIGPISGCHINPAVSVGAVIAGRMSASDLVGYVIAQVAGAIVAALVLMMIAKGNPDWNGGLGTTTIGAYGTTGAFVFEAVATFLFVVVILGATQKAGAAGMAGLAIGLALIAIHIAGIPVSGSSVNPARSIGPALFAGGDALKQVWLYIVAPILGAGVAGFLFRNKMLEVE